MRLEHEFELETFFDDRFFATIKVVFDVEPGEAPIKYHDDGSGYPGQGTSIDLIETEVTSLSNSQWSKTRNELEDFLGPGLMTQIDNQAMVESLIALEYYWLDELLLNYYLCKVD